jgi:glutathione-regulated potassium-efflux system ancillary protein KefC
VTHIYALATLWLALGLLATLLSIWLRIATAMSEILVGTVAQLLIGAAFGAAALGADESWIRFLASTGAVVLTFLAGAELDPQVMRREWKQASAAPRRPGTSSAGRAMPVGSRGLRSRPPPSPWSTRSCSNSG